jgi:hypothetical protein
MFLSFGQKNSFIIVYQSFFNSSVTNDNQTDLDVKRKNSVLLNLLENLHIKVYVEVVRGNQNQIKSNCTG